MHSESHDGQPVYYTLLKDKLTQFCVITMNDPDPCGDSDHVNELILIINNDLTRLDKIKFWTQLNRLCCFSGRPTGGDSYVATMLATPALVYWHVVMLTK